MQLSQVGHDGVRPMGAQLVCLPDPVDTDNQTKTAGSARLDASKGVLDHDRPGGSCAQLSNRFQEHGGGRFSR